jgi:hypothetical protein
MDAFKKYQDELFEFAKVEIFITDKTDELDKEIYENCVQIGVPAEHVPSISWSLFDALFYEAKQNAKQQLLASNNSADLIFYAWIDMQAGQIRYNFINRNHQQLPFSSELAFLADTYALSTAFCKMLQENSYPDSTKTLIFQETISKPKNFEYSPKKALGAVAFDMTMEAARSALGLTPKPFQKTLDAYSPTDAFDDSSIMISYDKNDRLQAIEVCPPHQVSVQGIELMGKPIKGTVEQLAKIAPYTITAEQDYDFRTLGILIPSSNTIKYLLLYRPGYWDGFQL